MATRDISYSLNGQRFTIPLTNNQNGGIQSFIGFYNERFHGQDFVHEEELGDDEDLRATISLYILEEGFPMDEDLELWEEQDTGGEHNISMRTVGRLPNRIYRDWNRETLQGFITASQWLGVNWRDYVTNITIDGQPAQID